jgi:hypothetical protein
MALIRARVAGSANRAGERCPARSGGGRMEVGEARLGERAVEVVVHGSFVLG